MQRFLRSSAALKRGGEAGGWEVKAEKGDRKDPSPMSEVR